MQSANFTRLRPLFLLATTLMLFACGGGGGGDGGGDGGGGESTTTEPPPPPAPITASEAGRFLSQATFGPSSTSIDELVAVGLEDWLLTELEKPASLHLDTVLAGFPPDGKFFDEFGVTLPEVFFLASDSFWKTAIEADDQLRQRMAYALSQILVASSDSPINRSTSFFAFFPVGSPHTQNGHLNSCLRESPLLILCTLPTLEEL